MKDIQGNESWILNKEQCVYNYFCKFSQKTGYLPCRKEIRIIFPFDSFEVLVEESNTHEHAEDPDYTGGQSTVYRWSKEATDIIVIGVKNGLRPKVMLRNMRDRNCFANYRDNDSALQQDYKHQESVETDRQLGQYSPVTSKTPAAFRGS